MCDPIPAASFTNISSFFHLFQSFFNEPFLVRKWTDRHYGYEQQTIRREDSGRPFWEKMTVFWSHDCSYSWDWNVKPSFSMPTLDCNAWMHLFSCASLAFRLFSHNRIYILPSFSCVEIFYNKYNFEFDTYRSRCLKLLNDIFILLFFK